VMDGWESRRRRTVGHDFIICQLPHAVQIQQIVIDTGFFTGNFVPAISIQAHAFSSPHDAVEFVTKQLPRALFRLVHSNLRYQGTAATVSEIELANAATAAWETIVPPTPLGPGYEETRYHTIDMGGDTTTTAIATHLRINAFPDGGIARIRVYGQRANLEHDQLPRCLYPPSLSYAIPHHHHHHGSSERNQHLPSQWLQNGSTATTQLTLNGQGLDCSNQHYGSPIQLLQASYGKDMGDGWETARHLNRPPILVCNHPTNHHPDGGLVEFGTLTDWCILALGQPAQSIHSVVVDTKHFRGNYPESVLMEGRCNTNTDDTEEWQTIVPRCRLAPDAEHLFSVDNNNINQTNVRYPIRIIRVTIFPDGGLSRVRVYGEPLME
jgi:allantoicase